MAGIILKMEGQRQSYGIQSHYSVRDTEKFPTKSAVVNMVRAAAGIGRTNEKLIELNDTKMTVRIDYPGEYKEDFRTAQFEDRLTRGEKPSKNKTIVQYKHYLCDASFLVLLDSPDSELIEWVAGVVKSPEWYPYLGRREYEPSAPIYVRHWSDKSIGKDILEKEPWFYRGDVKKPEKLEYIQEIPNNDKDGILIKDVMINSADRIFSYRKIKSVEKPLNAELIKETPSFTVSHGHMPAIKKRKNQIIFENKCDQNADEYITILKFENENYVYQFANHPHDFFHIICKSLPSIDDGGKGRCLFSVQESHIIVKTEKKPDWSFLNEYNKGIIKCCIHPVIYDKWDQLNHLRCWLRYNPVKRLDGKNVLLKTERERLEWLNKRSKNYGLKILNCNISHTEKVEGKQHNIIVADVELEIKVVDKELFVEACKNGIGREKNAGCGLLLFENMIFRS